MRRQITIKETHKQLSDVTTFSYPPSVTFYDASVCQYKLCYGLVFYSPGILQGNYISCPWLLTHWVNICLTVQENQSTLYKRICRNEWMNQTGFSHLVLNTICGLYYSHRSNEKYETTIGMCLHLILVISLKSLCENSSCQPNCDREIQLPDIGSSFYPWVSKGSLLAFTNSS